RFSQCLMECPEARVNLTFIRPNYIRRLLTSWKHTKEPSRKIVVIGPVGSEVYKIVLGAATLLLWILKFVDGIGICAATRNKVFEGGSVRARTRQI
ncbi:unnamed protein product, partial [Linum tenue]